MFYVNVHNFFMHEILTTFDILILQRCHENIETLFAFCIAAFPVKIFLVCYYSNNFLW